MMHKPAEKQDVWDLDTRIAKIEMCQQALRTQVQDMQGDITEILKLMRIQKAPIGIPKLPPLSPKSPLAHQRGDIDIDYFTSPLDNVLNLSRESTKL